MATFADSCLEIQGDVTIPPSTYRNALPSLYALSKAPTTAIYVGTPQEGGGGPAPDPVTRVRW